MLSHSEILHLLLAFRKCLRHLTHSKYDKFILVLLKMQVKFKLLLPYSDDFRDHAITTAWFGNHYCRPQAWLISAFFTALKEITVLQLKYPHNTELVRWTKWTGYVTLMTTTVLSQRNCKFPYRCSHCLCHCGQRGLEFRAATSTQYSVFSHWSPCTASVIIGRRCCCIRLVTGVWLLHVKISQQHDCANEDLSTSWTL